MKTIAFQELVNNHKLITNVNNVTVLYRFQPTQLLHDQDKITTLCLRASTCPIQYIVKEHT